MKFEILERVKRYKDCSNLSLGFKCGNIIKCYSKKGYTIGGVALGPYPELYIVKWDNGEIRKGYLPHGLSKI